MESIDKYDVDKSREVVRAIRKDCLAHILPFVKYTDAERTFGCDITIGEESAYALSSLEMPHVSEMYRDGENIYAIIDGYECDLDFIDVMDLLTIVEELQK